MSQNVEVTFSSNDAGVIAYLQKQNAEILKNQERLVKLGQAGKKASEDLRAAGALGAASLSSLAVKAASAASAYISLGQAIEFAQQANKRQIDASDVAAMSLDSLRRKSRVQSGRTEEEQASADKSIEQIAIANAIPIKQAYLAETQLTSSGVSAGEAAGGTLNEFLRMLSAQGVQDENAQPLADALTQLMKAQGKDVNSENMRAIAVQLQSLKDTKLKVTDIPQLAEIAAGLQGKLTEQEQLSTFATLGDVVGFPIAATQMRDIFKNFEVAGGKADATKYLEKMGLSPQDVDFVGESFQEVIRRFSAGLQSLPEDERTTAIAKVLEGTNVGTYRLIEQNMRLIQQRAGNLNQGDVLEQDIRIAQGGFQAAATRQESQKLIMDSQVGGAASGTLLRDEILRMQQQSGMSAVTRDAYQMGFDWARYAGLSAESASLAGEAPFSTVLGAFAPRFPSATAAQESLDQKLGSELGATQKSPLIQSIVAALGFGGGGAASKLPGAGSVIGSTAGAAVAVRDQVFEMLLTEAQLQTQSLQRIESSLAGNRLTLPAVPVSNPGRPPGRRPSSALSK